MGRSDGFSKPPKARFKGPEKRDSVPLTAPQKPGFLPTPNERCGTFSNWKCRRAKEKEYENRFPAFTGFRAPHFRVRKRPAHANGGSGKNPGFAGAQRHSNRAFRAP